MTTFLLTCAAVPCLCWLEAWLAHPSDWASLSYIPSSPDCDDSIPQAGTAQSFPSPEVWC